MKKTLTTQTLKPSQLHRLNPHSCRCSPPRRESIRINADLRFVDEITEVNPGQSLWSSKTPKKPANLPRWAQNCRVALSVKEVKDMAVKLRLLGQGLWTQPNPVGSVGGQIGSRSGDAPIGKPKKKVYGSIKLLENYEILGKLFDSLDSLVRLLQLKDSMSTFTNISPKIEYLTDRRFSYSHLAQLKFILPEVIRASWALVEVLPGEWRTEAIEEEITPCG